MRCTAAINTLVQEQGGSVKGIVAVWKQRLNFLPGIWSGLGFDLNYTFSPSSAGYKDPIGDPVPLQDNSVHCANAILWCQYEGLQARLAYNYRSKRAVTKYDIWSAAITD